MSWSLFLHLSLQLTFTLSVSSFFFFGNNLCISYLTYGWKWLIICSFRSLCSSLFYINKHINTFFGHFKPRFIWQQLNKLSHRSIKHRRHSLTLKDKKTQQHTNTGANVTFVFTVEAQWDSAIFGGLLVKSHAHLRLLKRGKGHSWHKQSLHVVQEIWDNTFLSRSASTSNVSLFIKTFWGCEKYTGRRRESS